MVRILLATVLALCVAAAQPAWGACVTDVRPDWTSQRPHPAKPFGILLFRSASLQQDVILLWFSTPMFNNPAGLAAEACQFATQRYAAQIDKSPATLVVVEGLSTDVSDDHVDAFAFTRAPHGRVWRRVQDRSVIRTLIIDGL
jgi:hypothetical protein